MNAPRLPREIAEAAQARRDAVPGRGAAPTRLERHLLRRLDRERRARQQAEQQQQLLLWASEQGLWQWRAEGDQLRIEGLQVGGALLDWPASDAPATLGSLLLRLQPADRLALLRALRRSDRPGPGAPITASFRIEHQGRLRWLQLRGRVELRDGQGRPLAAAGLVQDISARREAERALDLMAQAFASAHDALVVVDAQGQVLQANAPFARLLGRPAASLPGQPLARLLPLQADDLLSDAFTGSFSGAWRGESRLGSGARARQVEITVTPVPGSSAAGGAALPGGCAIVALRDVSERRRAERALQRLAWNDSLTGLANRAAITSLLDGRTAEAGPDAAFGLLFVDLDGFKAVNDTHGHASGDELLCQVAARLTGALPQARVGRWGGDEFVIVLPNGSAQALEPALAEAAQAVLDVLARPLMIGHQALLVTPSIGAAACPQDATDTQALLRRADAAMYAAKAAGRNRMLRYHAALDDELLRRSRLQQLLRLDAEREGFHFVAQPQVAADGRLVGGELLMRWVSDGFGPVSPVEFIPLAEQSGAIELMGRQALQAAAQLAAQVHAAGGSATVAVNLSPRQLLRDDLEAQVLDACRRHGAQPAWLELELTESALVSDIAQASALLQRLRGHGFRLALDDFGTGYSSLSHLRQLPFHKVKIDRSFVQHVDQDERSRLLLQGIVGLCRSLGLDTVAEGVESTAQFECLRELGINRFQGYLFARPLELDQWLALALQQRGQ
ncbi:MAG: EAL domain-containing protein [Burkholderiaceae bacterium]|nr:EAL domain-containing protein [Burkholderiaceae bacterium]